MENAIEITELCKVYTVSSSERVIAIDNLSLEIKEGEFIAIEGVSGSGKTTLLNMIGTLDVPTSGCIKIKGMIITKMNSREMASFRNAYIGFVLQDFALVPYYTGYENIEVPLLFVRKHIDRKRRIEELAEMLDISNLLARKVNTMSGGQKQRIAIARALVNDPPIILADEPTGALDSKTKEEIVHLLRSIADSGKTVVMVTHDIKAASYADRVITVSDGKINPCQF